MARSNNNNKLKAFVRFDGSGRIVPSSLIVQAFKPKVGNYKQIDAKECCNYTTTTTTTAAPTTTTTTTVEPTTTTTTTSFIGYYTWLMGKNVSAAAACAEPSTAPVYSAVSPLALGVILYENTALTTPVAISFYAIDGVAYEAGDGTGEITSVTVCP